jgi:hypothetical protein
MLLDFVTLIKHTTNATCCQSLVETLQVFHCREEPLVEVEPAIHVLVERPVLQRLVSM